MSCPALCISLRIGVHSARPLIPLSWRGWWGAPKERWWRNQRTGEAECRDGRVVVWQRGSDNNDNVNGRGTMGKSQRREARQTSG